MTSRDFDAFNIEPVEVEEIHLDMDNGTSVNAKYHSELAMQAARKMRRTRQKLKTGQLVCHHLRMMLASNDPVAKPAEKPDEPQYRLGF